MIGEVTGFEPAILFYKKITHIIRPARDHFKQGIGECPIQINETGFEPATSSMFGLALYH